jgi:hypothetical protein
LNQIGDQDKKETCLNCPRETTAAQAEPVVVAIAPDAIPFTHDVEELGVLEVASRIGAGMDEQTRELSSSASTLLAYDSAGDLT